MAILGSAMDISSIPAQQAVTTLTLSASGALRSLSDGCVPGKMGEGLGVCDGGPGRRGEGTGVCDGVPGRKGVWSGVFSADYSIAAAAVSLHVLREAAGSEKVLELLCSSAVNVLKEKTTAEYETELNMATPLGTGASLWQDAGRLAAASCCKEVHGFLAELQKQLERSLYLLPAYIKLSAKVLEKHEVWQFLHCLRQNWWEVEIDRILSELGVTDGKVANPGEEVLEAGWGQCVQVLWLLHLVQSVHACVSYCMEESLAGAGGSIVSSSVDICKEWLCRDLLLPVLRPLASSTPRLLYKVYQLWGTEDQGRVRESATPTCAGQLQDGLIFRSCDLLCCALRLFSAGVSCDEATLLNPAVETILRLGSHYREQLAQYVKLVPKEAPLKLWYLVLNTALYLHGNLIHLQSNPALGHMSTSHRDVYVQLLHFTVELCDALRERITSYHMELCTTTLLHDSSSHDWQNDKVFFEGERISFSVQMWHYHLLGLKHDLWSICPGPVASKILSSVTASSIAQLAQRYSHVSPSYSRVGQFRADILSILVTSASLLPHFPSTAFSSPSLANPEVTRIHRSCSHLLSSLAFVGCPLEQLAQSLSAHKTSATLGGEDSSLGRWMDFVPLAHFGLFPIHRSLSSPKFDDDSTLLSDFLTLVSQPYPQWDLLLKVLLSGEVPFAVSLCKQSSAACSAAVTLHAAQVLAHCYHRPKALTSLHVCLGAHEYISKRIDPIKENTGVVGLLFSLVKEALQGYVLSEATVFSSKALQCVSICCRPLPELGGFLVKVMEGLESRLMQLPKPVLNLLWSLSETLRASSTPAVQLGCGPSLAKLLGLLIGGWLDVPDSLKSHVQPSVLVSLDAYFSLLKHTLSCAGAPQGRELSSLAQEWQQVWQLHGPLVRERAERFGSNLHSQQQSPATSGIDGGGGESDIEHEVVADILMANSQVLQSLQFLYRFLKANKESITELLHPSSSSSSPPSFHLPTTDPSGYSESFDPLSACLSLGSIEFDHQWLMEASEIDWKGLLENFAVDGGRWGLAGREGVGKIVERRFELSQGAQLQGREPEMVQTIKTWLQEYSRGVHGNSGV